MFSQSAVIRALFALCLLAATLNHVLAILQHGLLWDYGYGNEIALFSKIYWDLLTIFDPLAGILLFLNPRAGILTTGLIITSDVAINTHYVALHGQWLAPFYLSQVGFLLLVLCLSPLGLGIHSPLKKAKSTT